MRANLEFSDKIDRSLSEEIEFTLNYLELEKIRFKDNFEYYIDIGKNVDQNKKVPKMIIQNYAENAVKHGLKHKKSNRKLWIKITSENKNVRIVVEDNGVGREKAIQSEQFSTGKGLKIMNTIYDLYFKLYKIRIVQNIDDLYDANGNSSGTRVTLYIPAH